MRRIVGSAVAGLSAIGLAGAATLAYWSLRPNRARVDPRLVLEVWPAVADGRHNSNTDLTFWNGRFYLVHQASRYHMGHPASRLLLWRSRDARLWEQVAEFKAPQGEYRDPKFAAIGGKLFIYALPNRDWFAEPYTTVYTWSTDGETWHPEQEAEPKGWLFWRPKTLDGQAWYVPAYWHEHGRSILLRSGDGLRWEKVSQIYEGEKNDETDMEFLPDGRIVATCRLEGTGSAFGDPRASTAIAVADPPYTSWRVTKSAVTRLDGPCLFRHGGRVFAVGRRQASFAPKTGELGSIYTRKRTSIFSVREDGLDWLTDLPSAGDTAYAGVVIRGDDLYISYYTSRLDRDYPWALGMVRPSDIMMARVSLSALAALAGAPPSAP